MEFNKGSWKVNTNNKGIQIKGTKSARNIRREEKSMKYITKQYKKHGGLCKIKGTIIKQETHENESDSGGG